MKILKGGRGSKNFSTPKKGAMKNSGCLQKLVYFKPKESAGGGGGGGRIPKKLNY